jgi:phosphoribosyl-ATP pyrophosphohydrolase/phosphoribosyl-AMP cyclohydrolase
MLDLSRLDFAKGDGLVTVVTQDATTGAVLMVAHADREALEHTLATGEMHYRSRTRGLWHKGATSGNVQRVVSLSPDCDGDAVLARVIPAGPACHTGALSCFAGVLGDRPSSDEGAESGKGGDGEEGRAGERDPGDEGAGRGGGAGGVNAIAALDATIARRAVQGSTASQLPPSAATTEPAGAAPTSYTRRLLEDRNLRLKKLGEEVAELIAACADGDRPRAVQETADVLYHALVALHAVGGSLADVQQVLAHRAASRAAVGEPDSRSAAR